MNDSVMVEQLRMSPNESYETVTPPILFTPSTDSYSPLSVISPDRGYSPFSVSPLIEQNPSSSTPFFSYETQRGGQMSGGFFGEQTAVQIRPELDSMFAGSVYSPCP